METYQSIAELPPVLSAKDIKAYLGISTGMVHELLNSEGFPTLKINTRKLVRKEHFIQWMEDNTAKAGA